MKKMPRITNSTSNTQTRRLVKQYLHSILKPHLRVFISKNSIYKNRGYGLRNCFQVAIWPVESSRQLGDWFDSFERKDILPNVIEGLTHFHPEWFKHR